MTTTKHIGQRMSQRGISKDMVDLALTHGSHDGDKFILGKKQALERLEALQDEARVIKKILDKGGVVVVESGGLLITTYNRDHRRH